MKNKCSSDIKNLFGHFPGAQKPKIERIPSETQVKQKYEVYKIIKSTIKNCSYRFNQISQSFLNIKNHLQILSNEIPGIDTSLTKSSGFDKKPKFAINQENNKILVQIIDEGNKKIAQIYSEYGKQMDTFLNRYAEVVKNKFTKFKGYCTDLTHYKEKVSGLQNQCESNKIQRNREKLANAQKEYDEYAKGINNDLKKIIEEGRKMLINNYSKSLVNLLKERNQTKTMIEKSDIFKKSQVNEIDFFEFTHEQIAKNDQSPQIHDPTTFYHHLEISLVNNAPSTNLKPQKIAQYFRNHKFSPKNDQNIFDKFDYYSQKPQGKSLNSSGQPFSAFGSVFSNDKAKKYHQMNELDVEETNSPIFISNCIKIKEIRDLHTPPTPFDSNNHHSQKHCLSAKMPHQKQHKKSHEIEIDKLPKPRRKQSENLMDLIDL